MVIGEQYFQAENTRPTRRPHACQRSLRPTISWCGLRPDLEDVCVLRVQIGLYQRAPCGLRGSRNRCADENRARSSKRRHCRAALCMVIDLELLACAKGPSTSALSEHSAAPTQSAANVFESRSRPARWPPASGLGFPISAASRFAAPRTAAFCTIASVPSTGQKYSLAAGQPDQEDTARLHNCKHAIRRQYSRTDSKLRLQPRFPEAGRCNSDSRPEAAAHGPHSASRMAAGA